MAARLFELREFTRACPGAPAQQSGLTPLELQTLAARLARALTSVRDVAPALGRLGGHTNRKSDGMPGWLTMWRGARNLQLLVEGVRIANKMKMDNHKQMVWKSG